MRTPGELVELVSLGRRYRLELEAGPLLRRMARRTGRNEMATFRDLEALELTHPVSLLLRVLQSALDPHHPGLSLAEVTRIVDGAGGWEPVCHLLADALDALERASRGLAPPLAN